MRIMGTMMTPASKSLKSPDFNKRDDMLNIIDEEEVKKMDTPIHKIKQ